ncbi:hypothetical protein [Caballeronia sp. dw_19]|uniref:hypothetical protein n=1 Tax=Caballeronia sp. dw_19 TaxID=2719791 RepID=UPI001BCF1198|nr:hypothetical protein [Caballeronia sp. dw_19]
MIAIPAVTDPESGVQSPSTPIPADAIAVVCDGATYTVYQTGDALPDAPPQDDGVDR